MISVTSDGKMDFHFYMHAQVAKECLVQLAN